VIQYFHTKPTPPPWLGRCPHLSHREVREGFAFGIGEGHYLTPPPEGAQVLEGGWSVWMNADGPQPETLTRRGTPYPVSLVMDGQDHLWAAPIILLADGSRAFKVHYGKTWLPELTATQQELMTRAGEARLWLDEFERTGSMPNPSLGAATAARFLSETSHVTMEVIGALLLMDDVLMLAVLLAAVSREIDLADGDHG
jgi:hypothetical protein